DNTATGFQALMNNTSVDNTANGASALRGNTTGSANTAVGSGALILIRRAAVVRPLAGLLSFLILTVARTQPTAQKRSLQIPPVRETLGREPRRLQATRPASVILLMVFRRYRTTLAEMAIQLPALPRCPATRLALKIRA